MSHAALVLSFNHSSAFLTIPHFSSFLITSHHLILHHNWQEKCWGTIFRAPWGAGMLIWQARLPFLNKPSRPMVAKKYFSAFPYQYLAYSFVEPVRSEFSTHHTLPLVCGKLWPNAFSKLKCQFLIREYFFIFFTFSLLQTKLLISLCLYNMLVGFNTFP